MASSRDVQDPKALKCINNAYLQSQWLLIVGYVEPRIVYFWGIVLHYFGLLGCLNTLWPLLAFKRNWDLLKVV